MLDFAVTHEPRATFAAAPGTGEAPTGPTNVRARRLPRRILDGHGMAGDDGERRAKRPRSGTARRFGSRERGRSPRDRHGRPPRSTPARRASTARPRHLLALQQRGGLVEGRARDQRHDRLRGSLPAPLPRPARARQAAASAAWIREPPAARRLVGDLLRRARRPLDLRRGLRRAAPRGRPGRRRAHAQRRGIRPRGGRRRAAAGSSRACGSRCSASGRGPTVPTLPPEQILLPVRAPLSIYSFGCWARQTIVALLDRDGAPRPRGRSRFGIDELRGAALPPAPSDGRLGSRLPRSARPCVPRVRPPAVRHPAAPGTPHSRALDRRAAGARRLLGRDPAAVGLVDRRPARARLRARPPGDRARRSPGSTPSRSTTSTGGASRRVSRPSGTPHSR